MRRAPSLLKSSLRFSEYPSTDGDGDINNDINDDFNGDIDDDTDGDIGGDGA